MGLLHFILEGEHSAAHSPASLPGLEACVDGPWDTQAPRNLTIQDAGSVIPVLDG